MFCSFSNGSISAILEYGLLVNWHMSECCPAVEFHKLCTLFLVLEKHFRLTDLDLMVDSAVLCLQLDSMILEVFSSLNDSVILRP